MADPSTYNYPSPLAGYENAPPLPVTFNPDGKSFQNERTGKLSAAYERFPEPIENGQTSGGFDAHVYFYRNNPEQVQFAKELWERIRREFPELRIYKIFDEPVGPHTLAMFEVDILTPVHFGAFVPWLVINRGPLSVLLHPNTDDTLRDHTQRATWLGKEVPIDIGLLRKLLGKAK
ncbi:DOPA-like domain-containing protein [Tuber borchii]|uniref:DOPA-like domain-containing protein n=1 Tax=Tuber borchii TaxID=42251 RepID=A0A2T7A2A7_TUBBO|nr:DOPA-like domain-containing protein [Tuber borchii]